MSNTITFVNLGDWHMAFVGDKLLLEGHSLDPVVLTRELMDVDYDSVRTWERLYTEELEFVEYTDQIPAYLKEHGLSVLFDE